MIVLRGATSQWKRWRCERLPIGPASAPPAQTFGITPRWPSTTATSTSCANASSRSRSSSMRAPRNAAVEEKTITPALRNSPRSTRGTTRTIAQSNGWRLRIGSILHPRARRFQAAEQVVAIRRRPLRQPLLGDESDDLVEHRRRQLRGQLLVDIADLRRPRQQHVLLALRERFARALDRVGGPVVMKDQRRAVIDHPEIAMPDEEVRVLRRAIDVRHERVEPDDGRRQPLLAAQRAVDVRIECDRSRQKVEADVQPFALLQQLLDLRIGLRARDASVELHEHDLRHRQAERAGDLAGDHLRRERALAP